MDFLIPMLLAFFKSVEPVLQILNSFNDTCMEVADPQLVNPNRNADNTIKYMGADALLNASRTPR